MGDAEVSAGLLLFFNHRLFLGLEVRPGALQAWTGGTRTWGGEPLSEDVRALELAIVKRENIVDMHYRVPGVEEWTHYPLTLECSGYHANTVNDLVIIQIDKPATRINTAKEVKIKIWRFLENFDKENSV